MIVQKFLFELDRALLEDGSLKVALHELKLRLDLSSLVHHRLIFSYRLGLGSTIQIDLDIFRNHLLQNLVECRVSLGDRRVNLDDPAEDVFRLAKDVLHVEVSLGERIGNLLVVLAPPHDVGEATFSNFLVKSELLLVKVLARFRSQVLAVGVD